MSKQSKSVKTEPIVELIADNQCALESSLKANDGRAVHIEMPILGTLVDFTKSGHPVVEHNYSDKKVQCLSTIKLEINDLKKKALLVFAEGDIENPIITGLIEEVPLNVGPKVISNDDGLILKTLNASLEMDGLGNVLLEGRTINTQAYATNRIKGGSVKIN